MSTYQAGTPLVCVLNHQHNDHCILLNHNGLITVPITISREDAQAVADQWRSTAVVVQGGFKIVPQEIVRPIIRGESELISYKRSNPSRSWSDYKSDTKRHRQPWRQRFIDWWCSFDRHDAWTPLT